MSTGFRRLGRRHRGTPGPTPFNTSPLSQSFQNPKTPLTQRLYIRTLPSHVGPSPSILAFNPDDNLAANIIRALAEPTGSLDAVAKARGISLADLALWLTTPKARQLMLTIERGACTHVRMAASLNLTASVRALVQILDDFRALAPDADPSNPAYFRASIHARKAAYHLYRLSRLVPLDDSDLARARSLIHDRTASASERTPPSPSPTVYPVGSLPDLRPAAVLKTDADSLPPVPIAPAQPSDTQPATAPSSSTPSSAIHSPSALHKLHPTSSLKDDVDSLNSNLESLAHSLGLDISDLDESAPLPPEFLATLPPALAAFLTETDPPHPPNRAPTPQPLCASP